MASWVIAYGFIQASAPAILKRFTHGKAPSGVTATKISVILTLIMGAITILFFREIFPAVTVVGSLLLFGAFFALNSSVHSFLILDYADGEKAAVNVGFYYMANAMGRLVGTLLSGLLFQSGGVVATLLGSAIFLGLTSLISTKLPSSNN